MVPGSTLTIDEDTCRWKASKGELKYRADGVPSLTKIKGKPEPVCIMLKSCADSKTKIKLSLEVQEGKERMHMASKEHAALGAGTSITLRLTRFWWHSKRLVVGDSYFGSVQTAVKMLSMAGLYHTGVHVVKTATRGFPKTHLSQADYPHLGAHQVNRVRSEMPVYICEPETRTLCVCVDAASGASGDQDPVIGCGLGHEGRGAGGWWRQEKEGAHLDFHDRQHESSPRPGNPHVRVFRRLQPDTEEYKTVVQSKPRPQLVEDYFEAASAIDIHNHYRQGGLAIERNVLTKNWAFRLILFCTILGIIVVDAYLAYLYDHREDPEPEKTLLDHSACS